MISTGTKKASPQNESQPVKVQSYIAGREIKKVIVVKGRLVNIVVK